LGEACQLAEDAKADHDREKATLQAENEGLLFDLNQVQVGKVEAEKKAGDFIAKVQKEVRIQALEVRAGIQGLGARKSTVVLS